MDSQVVGITEAYHHALFMVTFKTETIVRKLITFPLRKYSLIEDIKLKPGQINHVHLKYNFWLKYVDMT